MLGAVLAFVAMASLTALVTRPFLPADESNNVAYSLTVSRGELPLINAHTKSELPGQLRAPLNYVANHPPLYYFLVSPGLRYAVESGHWQVGIALARLETLVLSVGAISLTAALATALARRRRPELVVGAAALLATNATYAVHGGVVHNDGLALTLLTGQLVATVLVLLRGLRPPLVLAIFATAALGMLTRVSGVGLLALSAAALVVAGVLTGGRGRVRGALHGLAWASGLILLCGATSGWFYARNARLYGDFTGGDEVEKLLRLRPRSGSAVSNVLSPDTLNELITKMFGLSSSDPGLRTAVLYTMIATIALGAALVAARALSAKRRRPGSSSTAAGPRDGRPAPVTVAISVLLVLHVAIVLLEIGSHVKDGGGPQPRYLLPALPVLLTGAAAALLALPGRLGRPALVAAVLVQAALTVCVVDTNAGRSIGRADSLGSLVPAMSQSGVPLAGVVAGVLLLTFVAGLVLVVGAIWFAPRTARAGGRHLAAART